MGPGPGRPKGSTNKATREFRETIRKLLEDNSENVALWLGKSRRTTRARRWITGQAGRVRRAEARPDRARRRWRGPVQIVASKEDERL